MGNELNELISNLMPASGLLQVSKHKMNPTPTFLIRDRAPMVQRTLLNLLRLLLLLLLLSKLNRILEDLNMLEKSGNFAHASELVKIYVWYGFQE